MNSDSLVVMDRDSKFFTTWVPELTITICIKITENVSIIRSKACHWLYYFEVRYQKREGVLHLTWKDKKYNEKFTKIKRHSLYKYMTSLPCMFCLPNISHLIILYSTVSHSHAYQLTVCEEVKDEFPWECHVTDAKEIVRTSKLKGSIKLLNYYIERFIVFPQSSVVLKRTSYLVQSTFLMRCLQGFFEW